MFLEVLFIWMAVQDAQHLNSKYFFLWLKDFDLPHLFDELKIKEVTLRNRIGVSPMCQYSAEDGMMTDWHLVHIGSRAVGGAGLVMVEATGVESRGRITPGCTGIWDDVHISFLSKVSNFIKEQGAVAGIQIGHAGRKASCATTWEGGHYLSDEEGGWEAIAPSAIPMHEQGRVPREMTLRDIEQVQEAFRNGTVRAVESGFDWLEIHGAHGYLMHSFHSPISNKRTDVYGGSFENRIKFTVDTLKIVREEWPQEKPLCIRLSCSDWVDGGWTLDDTVKLSTVLKEVGVDVIDCSGGGSTPKADIPVGPGYQVPFSETVRKTVNIATASVGMITEPFQADQIIRNGQAEIVFLGRAFLRDPY